MSWRDRLLLTDLLHGGRHVRGVKASAADMVAQTNQQKKNAEVEAEVEVELPGLQDDDLFYNM
jgi:hypothetical protein